MITNEIKNKDNPNSIGWDDKIRMVLHNNSMNSGEFESYIMNWTDKHILINLGNQVRQGKKIKEFHKFVLSKISIFDDQAFDMLFNVLDLDPKKMLKQINFYKKLYPLISELDEVKIGFRGRMRMTMLKNICNEKLLIS